MNQLFRVIEGLCLLPHNSSLEATALQSRGGLVKWKLLCMSVHARAGAAEFGMMCAFHSSTVQDTGTGVCPPCL
ncbi:UNVERIFIED_CONTAM: hypothetical protein FKN15_002467 [Acipenser sinensis]